MRSFAVARRLALTFSAALCLAAPTGTTAQAPGLRANLVQRDRAFSKLKFDWYVEHRTTAPGAEAKATKHWVEQAELTARQEAARLAVTDEARVREMIATEREIARRAGSKTDLSYKSLHEFTRDGDRTEAHATLALMEPAFELTTEWHQWYGDGWGALYADRTVGRDGVAAMNQGPFIWREKGDGAMFNAPFVSCLDITPSEFVLLTGKDPFKMYGDHWQTVTDTPADTVLRCLLTTGQLRNTTVEMTLDKAHGGVPKLIIARGRADRYRTYTVTRWKQYEGLWMPEAVDYAWINGNARVHRTWTLRAIGPGHPVKIDMPIGAQLADLRLLSDEPDFLSAGKALQAPNDNTVRYKWSGRLITLEELADLRHTHKTRTASWHNLLPGVLLLACGGIWFIRTRAAAKRTGPPTELPHDA